jgi:hypothetical protein
MIETAERQPDRLLNFETVDANEITIGIEEDQITKHSRFTYKPGESVGVEPGTEVTWSVGGMIEIETFALLFDNAATPFSKVMLHPDSSGQIKEKVRSNARAGGYKYTVAVVVGGRIYFDDPKLIVRHV